jgi:DNA-binding NtrC family response regulator
MRNTKILVIDDDPAMLEMVKVFLKSEGYEVNTAISGQDALKLTESERFDLILTDLHLLDLDGIEIVRRIKEHTPDTEIIMISGQSTLADTIEAIKVGAFYFVEKPFELEELMALIEKALERKRQAQEIKQLRTRLAQRDSYFDIVGSSRVMQNIYELIESVADSDANVLIIGESGTGKEMIANAIHFRSLRAKKPFVKVNCSALPKELIESELFGHTRGAFTGAVMDKTGLIGQANGGSLLLDEIGDMPVELQPKLLRVLQDRVYYRLGSEKPLTADFRLISATNRDPLQAVKDGQLREDLYYRINTIVIHVPPLRERTEDIQRLAGYFLNGFAEKYRRNVQSISHQAWARLLAHSWPGNVRELQNAIERAVLLCKGETIEVEDLPIELEELFIASAPQPAQEEATGAPTPELQPMTLQDYIRAVVYLAPLRQTNSEAMTFFEQIEGPIVSAALERTSGNKQAAADLLGIHRPRLYNILKRHNLQAHGAAASAQVEGE